MTKEEIVAMLKRSVEEWNEWYLENPENFVDLSNTNLSDADLRNASLYYINFNNANLNKANLSRVNLQGAEFIDASLIHADMNNANLSSVDFSNADLSYAYLRGANLQYADLSDADLSNADLMFADLSNADLCNVDFSNSKIESNIFNDIDLRGIKNIDKIKHEGPSYIDTKTFQKSQGQIPEIFLKGCGLSDWEIESVKLYNPKLTPTEVTDILYKMDELRNEKPLQFHNLFISYNHKDAPFADALEKYLDAKGIRFWRDVHDAPAGRLDKIVLREMKDRVVLLLFSKNSVNSDWVEFEIENARRLEKEQGRDVLCPIALDDAWQTCGWSPILMNQIKKYHVLDFSNWEEEKVMERQFNKLLKGLDLFYK